MSTKTARDLLHVALERPSCAPISAKLIISVRPSEHIITMSPACNRVVGAPRIDFGAGADARVTNSWLKQGALPLRDHAGFEGMATPRRAGTGDRLWVAHTAIRRLCLRERPARNN